MVLYFIISIPCPGPVPFSFPPVSVLSIDDDLPRALYRFVVVKVMSLILLW